jgi:hypothetical protein
VSTKKTWRIGRVAPIAPKALIDSIPEVEEAPLTVEDRNPLEMVKVETLGPVVAVAVVAVAAIVVEGLAVLDVEIEIDLGDRPLPGLPMQVASSVYRQWTWRLVRLLLEVHIYP